MNYTLSANICSNTLSLHDALPILDIIHAGNVVYSTGSAAEEIADLNLSKKAKKLVGKKLVVVSIENPQDAAMGMGSAVAKEADGKKVYDVSLLQAFYTGEILLDGKH